MTVAELLSRMSSREFSEWMAFYGIEPFGAEITDLQNAVNTAASVNASIAAGGGKQRVQPDQFRLINPDEPADDGGDALYQKFANNPILGKRNRAKD